MNKFATLALTMVFSFGGASTVFASSMDDKVPQTKDLSVQEMSSTMGAGRIFWKTKAPKTYLYQHDSRYHKAHRAIVKKGGWYDIGKHNIRYGQRVVLWCKGYSVRHAVFKMRYGNVRFRCW